MGDFDYNQRSMKRLYILIVIWFTVLTLSLSVFAQDKPVFVTDDIIFQPGGGVRARYFNRIETRSSRLISVDGQINGRFQLDFSLNKGEFFKVFSRLIHRNNWGRQSDEGGVSPLFSESFTDNNGLFVNEAWGWWQWTDTLSVQLGRAPLSIGSGKTYGANQWFDLPTSFDQFNIFWEWEQVQLKILGAKLRDLDPDVNGSGGGVADPEENHYIANLDLGGIAEWISLWNLHFAQVERDEGAAQGGSLLLPKLRAQLWSGEFQFDLSRFHGEFFSVFINGAQQFAGEEERRISQSAFDMRLQYAIPAASEMTVKLSAHLDNGDSSQNLTNGQDAHFRGFYYDIYDRSGKMDLFRWGNLLFFHLGLSIEPRTDLQVGADVHYFERRDPLASVNWGLAGLNFQDLIGSGDLVLSNSKSLGSELDLWIRYTSPIGVKTSLTYSAFLPGEAFRSAMSSTSANFRSTLHQFILELSYFF